MGWRGYLLPLLLSKYKPLKSSIIIGGIWAFWHLPVFFASNVNGNQTTIFTFFIFISCFPLSMLLTALFLKSGKSVLICMLFHDGVNTGIGYFMGNSASNDLGSFKLCVIIYFLIAAVTLMSAKYFKKNDTINYA